MRNLLARLATADLIVFGYGGITLAAILACFPRLPSAPSILAAHLAFLAAAAAVLACAARFPGRGWRVARDWYPLLAIPAAFRELHYLVPAVHPADRHELLIAWDRALFGVNPTVALEPLLHPAAVEVLTLCYTSYYFLPVALGLALYLPGRRAEYAECLAAVVAAFFTSYLGYFIIPAKSPYLYEDLLGHARRWGADAATLGWGLAPAIRHTLESLELEMRDAFPSGHVEVTLVVLACAWRRHRPVFWSLLAPATGLIAATVYLRYHYVVDVLAGAALAALVVWTVPRWHAARERRTPADGQAAADLRDLTSRR